MKKNTKKSPMQDFIDKCNLRLEDDKITTKKLCLIISLVEGMREGLLEAEADGDALPANKWWADKAIIDFTKIMVTANFKAHQKLNPTITMPSLESQIKDAVKDIKKQMK